MRPIHHPLIFASALLGATACGGPTSSSATDRRPADDAPAAADTSGDAAEPDVTVTTWVPQVPSLDDPELSVRVDGPDPVPVTEPVIAPDGRFETRVLVTNQGDEPAEVERAHVAFDVWSEDGQRTPCTRPEQPGPPPLLEPGEAHELQARAVCTFPGPGDYEVRTYVTFDAEALDGSLEVERYYAGRTRLAVRAP